MVKNLPAIQETQVRSLGWEDPLEKEVTTHSSIPAWRIPWTEGPGGLQSLRSQKSNMTERLNHRQAGPEERNSTESGVFSSLFLDVCLTCTHTVTHQQHPFVSALHAVNPLDALYFSFQKHCFCPAIQPHRECSWSRFPATLLVLQVTLTSFTVSLLWLLTAKSGGRIPSFAGSLLAQTVKNLPAVQETWVGKIP